MLSTHKRTTDMKAEICFAIGESSLGLILIAKSEKGICAVFIGDDSDYLLHELQKAFVNFNLIKGDKKFIQWIAEVIAFIELPSAKFNFPLDIKGTVFQLKVWEALRKIPFGKTASYTDIAKQMGSPKAVRAVAGACAANRIAVIIPCHRVVRNDGSLSGYRWGVTRKEKLLKLESEE